MHILVLCDDINHPAENIREGLSWLDNMDIRPYWLENAEDWRAEAMNAFQVVVLAKSNHASSEDEKPWMTKDTERAFANYVRRGGGLLAIHSGLADYDENTLFRSLLGGVLSHHPSQCPVTFTPKSGHPIATGSHPFTIPDEHYFVAMDDIQADVFLTSCSIYGRQPAGWTRTEGKGRVGVMTPGHNPAVWQHTPCQVLISNLLYWCAEKP